ncbi:MAG TPA: hypothetical protein VGB44_12415 [Flavobacterium sp.]|jgi:hypothetical protein
MKKFTVLKILGVVLLTMIALVCISFLEVAIYSYLVNTGQPESFYEEHANISAPYISGIFGFIISFLLSVIGKRNITMHEKLRYFILSFTYCWIL